MHGSVEFKQVVEYVGNLPHIPSTVCLVPEISDSIHLKLKETLCSLVWGHLFPEVGIHLFTIREGEHSGMALSNVTADCTLDSLKVVTNTSEFNLEKIFSIKVSSLEEDLKVEFSEEAFYKSAYTNPKVYDSLQEEMMVIIDATLAMGCTEAVVKSYCSVMASQYKRGNVSNNTLDVRTLVDWCIKSDMSYPKTISKIALKYLEGDVDHKLACHRTPIKLDNNSNLSKVINRHITYDKENSFLS